MTGRQIEEIMTDFYEGHYDVLLSTSIIETGLDILMPILSSFMMRTD